MCWNSNPQCDGIRRCEAFGRWLSHEAELSQMGLVFLLNRPPRALLFFLLYEDTEERSIYEPRNGCSPDTDCAYTLILDFPASRTLRNEILWFVNYIVCGILLQRPEPRQVGIFRSSGFLRLNSYATQSWGSWWMVALSLRLNWRTAMIFLGPNILVFGLPLLDDKSAIFGGCASIKWHWFVVLIITWCVCMSVYVHVVPLL